MKIIDLGGTWLRGWEVRQESKQFVWGCFAAHPATLRGTGAQSRLGVGSCADQVVLSAGEEAGRSALHVLVAVEGCSWDTGSQRQGPENGEKAHRVDSMG